MKKQQQGILSIGTSNIVVPGNKQSFPEEYRQKSRLNFYSSLFNSVEVNSSFYKVPMRSTFEKWAADVPEDFKFSVKLSKDITHIKDLEFDTNKIDSFLNAANGIVTKKGCLLVQFPGKINFDYYNKVEQILERLQQQDSHNSWHKAIEFRNPTWYVNETHELLDEYNASLILHDMPKSKNTELNKGSAIVYLRYHGPKGNYRESYSDSFLKEQFNQIQQWLKAGKDVYAYFNNTIGDALQNALTLKKMYNASLR
jgi:uncharacterized protein YecE (DUF72 family)